MEEKIKRFGILCKRGNDKGLTKQEIREFKKLERDISNTLLENEVLFDAHISAFKKAISQ